MILRFVAKKLAWGITIVIGSMLIMFVLVHAVPGSPWASYSTNPRAQRNLMIDDVTQRQLNFRFGLDLPLWRQFTRYLLVDFDNKGNLICGAVCGNLGPSIQQRGRTVQEIIFGAPPGETYWQSRFGYSIRLVFFAVLIVICLGLPIGIVSALKADSRLARALSVFLATLISIPNFVLGLLAVIILAVGLHWMPVLLDWNVASHWFVPAFVLAVMPMASLARVIRTSMYNVIHEDYIRTAQSKGLTKQRITLDHILRNSLVPIITYFGPVLMEIFVGLFVIEGLYAFPGMGRQYWQAVLALDYPMILGLTLIYAVGIVSINVINQVVCESIDPRIRAVSQGEAP